MNADRDLLARWADDDLDDDAEAALFQRVASDPTAAEQLTRAAEFEILLGECAAMVLGPAGADPIARGRRRRARPLPRRRLLALAAAVALVVATGLALIVPDGGAAGPVATTIGPDGAPLAASSRTLRAGDRVRAGAWPLELRYADDTTVRLAPGGEVALHAGPAKRLHLAHGRVRAVVTPQPSARPLTITTPTAAATVLGTVFELDATVGTSELRVHHGRVELRRQRDQRAVVVAAGHWSRDSDLRLRNLGVDLISSATWSDRSPGWNADGEWVWHLAHDGSTLSEIHADSRAEQWLEYTFDRPQRLERVRVYEDDEGSYSLGRWRLTALVDGEWRELVPWRAAEALGWHEVSLPEVVASRVRLHCLPPADALLEIYEFECYGTPAGP